MFPGGSMGEREAVKYVDGALRRMARLQQAEARIVAEIGSLPSDWRFETSPGKIFNRHFNMGRQWQDP
jgi:hypothetical protein